MRANLSQFFSYLFLSICYPYYAAFCGKIKLPKDKCYLKYTGTNQKTIFLPSNSKIITSKRAQTNETIQFFVTISTYLQYCVLKVMNRKGQQNISKHNGWTIPIHKLHKKSGTVYILLVPVLGSWSKYNCAVNLIWPDSSQTNKRYFSFWTSSITLFQNFKLFIHKKWMCIINPKIGNSYIY